MENEHNYTSALESFLPWHVWIYMNCTQEDIDIFDNPNSTLEQKKDLYERWLHDQQILTYTRIVDGNILQYQEWDWS